MPRGGARSGRPGQGYSNRTDLPGKVLPVSAAPGQQYAKAAAQQESQRVVPMAAPPVPQPPQGGAPQQPPAGGLGALDAPTARPGEPVTHGAQLGAGGGPEVLGVQEVDDLVARLRGQYLRAPSEDLRELLEELDAERY